MRTVATTRRFSGRTVVVTGAGSGIGRDTAILIATEGGRVVATDVDADRLDALTAQWSGLGMSTVAGDITDPTTVDAVLTAAGGRVHGLANVAGIMDGFLPPVETDDTTWDRVMAINLTAPMRLTRAALPGMIAEGGGAIVNVASEAALRASAAGAAYTASKHALIGYTKSVAFFHGPQGVRANAVLPGPVMTNIEHTMRSRSAAERLGPVIQATMPAPAKPDQLASAIAWLLSDDTANVNGAVLPCDGGWSVA